MHVWAIARARATMGGPSFDSRTHWRNASFQRSTTLSRAAQATLAAAADVGTPAERSTAPPAAAVVKNWRREIALVSELDCTWTSLWGRSLSGFIERPRCRSWIVVLGEGRRGERPP